MENEFDLEKKIKELDNFIFKVGQSAHTVHMLTKPQAFYDNIHNQALGYQNSFYLKKAQRIKPTLYDGIVISNKHVAMPVIDDEETLILKETSSMCFDKDLLNEIMEVQIVFDQMDVAVQQSSVDKQCLEIAKKELLLEIHRLLHQIMSQDIILTVMNSMSMIVKSVNMKRKRNESYEKCFNLNAELLKSQNAHNDLLKRIFKLDLVPIAPKLLQNKKAHIDYLKYTQEQDHILSGIVKLAKEKQPLDNALDFSCKHAQRIHELLVYVRDTHPKAINLSAKKVAITPKNNVKKVRISQTPSRNMKKKVEAQPRKVNKKNHVVEPVCNVNVKQSHLNADSKLICATCKKSMFKGVHDMCLLDFVNNVNGRRTFTLVGNSCPITRITSANVVPPKKTTSHSVETQKQELKVYRKKPKFVKNVGSSKKAKIVESKNANHSEPNES
nr:hypothetical protein [Tanacetum cinerariifolium]